MTIEPENIPDRATRSNCCDAWWTGMNTCHCAGCCVTWSSPSAFDLHRRGNDCRTPEESGLVRLDRDYEVYGWPGEDPRRGSDAAWTRGGDAA